MLIPDCLPALPVPGERRPGYSGRAWLCLRPGRVLAVRVRGRRDSSGLLWRPGDRRPGCSVTVADLSLAWGLQLNLAD